MPSTPRRPASSRPAPAAARGAPPARPLGEDEIDELQALLDAVPAPLEPLDVVMLDGYLCGVLVQPTPIAPERWLPWLTDSEARALPRGFDANRLHALAQRRHAELDSAIAQRHWFDPWVFELDGDEDDEDAVAPTEAVYPWVAGFATAMEAFPALTDLDTHEVNEALALLYRHFDPDDLEDADALMAEIEALDPPDDLGEAVEGLVQATLLLADITRPQAAPRAAGGGGAGRGPRTGSGAGGRGGQRPAAPGRGRGPGPGRGQR